MALAALAGGSALLIDQGWRHAVLLPLGGLLGLALYHAAFGFTAAYRNMMVRRDVAGVQAQLVMLAAATILFAPTLAEGTLLGRNLAGSVAPLGVQVMAGALLFGLGMQLGGGCGSGTLFALGGGSPRMMVTLAAFCAGSFAASLHMQWWVTTPRLPGLALGLELGWTPALIVQLALLAALWLVLRHWGRAAGPDGSLREVSWRRLLAGPWPLVWGALALALLNWLTLIVTGHPWSITWAFTLWGAKAAQALGWDPAGVWFWTGGFSENALTSSLLRDETSVMNAGIVIGAFCAAAAAGRLAPVFRIPAASLAAALIGGLLMGYGARIAFGCNIGAFFSGVASTSLHGWLWVICALAGTWIGIRLRPLCGLTN